MIDAVLALALWITQPRPQNWQAAIGIVQDVRLVTYPDGRTFVSLRYSDGRTVEVGDRLLYGPQAPRDYLAPPDQIVSIEDVEQMWEP